MDVDRDLDFLRSAIAVDRDREAGEDWLATRLALVCILNTNMAEAWKEGFNEAGKNYAETWPDPDDDWAINPHEARVKFTLDALRRRLV